MTRRSVKRPAVRVRWELEEYTPEKVRGPPEMRGVRENTAPCENRPPDGGGRAGEVLRCGLPGGGPGAAGGLFPIEEEGKPGDEVAGVEVDALALGEVGDDDGMALDTGEHLLRMAAGAVWPGAVLEHHGVADVRG